MTKKKKVILGLVCALILGMVGTAILLNYTMGYRLKKDGYTISISRHIDWHDIEQWDIWYYTVTHSAKGKKRTVVDQTYFAYGDRLDGITFISRNPPDSSLMALSEASSPNILFVVFDCETGLAYPPTNEKPRTENEPYKSLQAACRQAFKNEDLVLTDYVELTDGVDFDDLWAYWLDFSED